MEIKISLVMHLTPIMEGDILLEEEEARDKIIKFFDLDSNLVDDYELSVTINQHVTKG